MARIRSDLQIEKGLPTGNKVLAKPDGQTEVVQIEPYKVSPTTWIVDDAGVYENTPGQFEIPSLPYAKDVDTAFSRGGKVFKYNSAGGYFELVFDSVVKVIEPTENDIATFAANSGNYTFSSGDIIAIDDGMGAYNLYLYNGSIKTDTNSYLPLSVIQTDWSQITNTPTTLGGYGITDAATSAQGALADTAVQPGDNVSDLTNDAGYLTETTHDALPQDNPHGVTKAQVGLGNVDNTSDANKPVSTAQGLAINQAEADAKQYTDDEITGLNLGTASQANVGDFATSAQGAKADSAIQPSDIDTLAELNNILTDANLDDESNPRPPTAHTHTASEITDFDSEVSNNVDVSQNTTDRHTHANKTALDNYDPSNFATAAQGAKADSALQTESDPTVPAHVKNITNQNITDWNNADPNPADTDELPEGTTNKYYTETRVSSNSDVAANTAARHTHSNKALLDTYNQTNADIAQAISDANTAVQPGDLAPVATSGDYDDLINKPTIPDSLDDLAGNSDNITEGSTQLFFTLTERNKLSGVAPGAEVNVNSDWNAVSGDAEILNKPTLGTAAAADTGDFATSAQGTKADSAVQPTDTDVSANDWVLDEDDMISDSDTKVPTQQSVKAYVDANAGGNPVNLFTDDLTLTENRAHQLDGHEFKITGGANFPNSIMFQLLDGGFEYRNLYVWDNEIGVSVATTDGKSSGFVARSNGPSDVSLQIRSGQLLNALSSLDVHLKRVDVNGAVEYGQLEIPEYATDTDADNDSDLASGAPYSLTGDRTVYRKP